MNSASQATLPVVAIVGVGAVGAGLGARFAKAGYKVIFGSREPGARHVAQALGRAGGNSTAASPAEAAAKSDLVVLAIPWLQGIPVISSLGDLAGKVIVDVTNPISHAPSGGAVFALSRSVSEYLQDWAPKAFVVKAFNTSNLRTLAEPGLVDGAITIPIAGDDAPAKSIVAALATAAGFEPFDVGPLANARYLEAMALLYISINGQSRPDGCEFYLRPRPNLKLIPTPPAPESTGMS